MQFLVYNVGTAAQNTPPTPELMAEVGKFVEDAFKAGVLVTTGGLPPMGTRVRVDKGKVTVTDGPFIEAKEMVGGFAVLNVKSLEEAIEWTRRFREIVGDGESELVRIFGPE